MFEGLSNFGITSRAISNGLLTLDVLDLREFADNHYGHVDDRPYGGGPGMVMMAEPLWQALEVMKSRAPAEKKVRVIYVTPSGKTFNANMAREFAQRAESLVFIAGRYEGIDQRFIDKAVDEEISIGDYVLSGGELPIMVMIDAITRWLPGALGDETSVLEDAFSAENEKLLDCPHYTRPSIWQGSEVPLVLKSGDHKKIASWRKKQAIGKTWCVRPTYLAKLALNAETEKLLKEFQQEFE